LRLHTGVCRIHMDPSDRGVVSAAAHSVAARAMAAVEEAEENGQRSLSGGMMLYPSTAVRRP
jgi:hypothetical protein